AQHVAGAAECARLALDPEHGNRCLRRDSLDAAIDVMVEHDVAQADQARRRQLLDEGDQVRIDHAPLIGGGACRGKENHSLRAALASPPISPYIWGRCPRPLVQPRRPPDAGSMPWAISTAAPICWRRCSERSRPTPRAMPLPPSASS